MLHLELMHKSVATNISFSQAAELLKKSNTILANNVISYLQNASNKKLALTTYIATINKTIAQGDQVLLSLQSDYDDALATYQQCSADKTAADNQFFQ